MKKIKPWLVVGGRRGEVAHCLRCGIGLNLGGPQSIQITLGAINGFAKDHENCKPGDNPNPEVVTRHNWLESRDTGTSSLTIYAVMGGQEISDLIQRPPQDPDDFGRCHRLLYLFPEWKARMGEVAARFPEWGGLVRAWSNLETLYESTINGGDRSKLYMAIQDLLKESEVK